MSNVWRYDDRVFVSLLAAIIQQAATDMCAGYYAEGDEPTPVAFLDAAGIRQHADRIASVTSGRVTANATTAINGDKRQKREPWSKACACGVRFDNSGRYSAHARTCGAYRAQRQR